VTDEPLFPLTGTWSPIEAAPAVDTPLGRITLSASLGGWSTDAAAAEACRNERGSRVSRWESPVGRMELLLCRPEATLPEGMAVSDCWAGLWRVSPHSDVESCEFQARWEAGYGWSGGGPDSGQGLGAQTWADDRFEVTIGTQDGETILAQGQSGPRSPERLGLGGGASLRRCGMRGPRSIRARRLADSTPVSAPV